MFICEICLFKWFFAQFCTSYMSKLGYLEMFQKVTSTSRYRESTVVLLLYAVMAVYMIQVGVVISCNFALLSLKCCYFI